MTAIDTEDIGEAAVHGQRPPVDDWVRAIVHWHFDPATGSPYWLRRRASLDFDPLADVVIAADLRRFADMSADWSTVAVEDLLPSGRAHAHAPSVFESGGTMGRPKRIVETSSRARGVEWVDRVLAGHPRFPAAGDGHWLHIGPTGPHIVGRSIGRLAALRKAFCFYVDFDPRWVKRLVADARRDEVGRYVDHVVDQALAVLADQDVRVIFATPPVLEAICARPPALEAFRARTRGLIWSGTSISTETLRLLEQEIFPDAAVVGLYGNSLMGIAPQRPRLIDDEQPCVFQPFHPYALVEVVDPGDPGRVVDFGQRGRVRLSLLTADLFLPNVMERDGAIRVAPTADFPWTGVSAIGPLQAAGGPAIVEGVY
jgi:hypothetical protein